jgi:hypothetical protein
MHCEGNNYMLWATVHTFCSLQAAAAPAFDALFIVTRNVKHFRSAPIPAITPPEFLKQVDRLQ